MLPHVSMPLLNFAAVCDALQEDYDLALFFYEGGGAPLRTVLRPGCAKKIAIVTGSEGGFSVEEAEAAKAAGAVTVGLGPRILRCETAPLTALTAAMLLTGNLGITGPPYYSSAAARVKQRRTLWTRKSCTPF